MPTEDLEPLAYALHNLFRSTFRVVMAHVGDVTTSCDVTTCKLYSNHLYDRTCWFKIFIRVGSRRGSARCLAHHTALNQSVPHSAPHGRAVAQFGGPRQVGASASDRSRDPVACVEPLNANIEFDALLDRLTPSAKRGRTSPTGKPSMSSLLMWIVMEMEPSPRPSLRRCTSM